MSFVVELLQELIRIPSVNPQGNPGTPHVGEGEIARFAGDFLVRMEMEVEMQFAEKDRPNVLGRLKSKTSRRHLLLGPHLDTVSVAGMTIEPFGGEARDGRIWGRGASDTKGSMAAMLAAIQRIVSEKRLPENTDIWFIGLMGEESGNDGIAYLMNSGYFQKKGIKPDFGIAGEPTDLKIVHRHKGALWLRLRTRGRACHGSRPDLGDNAILKMRRAMDYVASELPGAYARLHDHLLGRSTFALTVMRGGSKVNIIPDICEIEVDHRSLPQESHAEVYDRIKKALPECEVEIISDRPGLDTPADDPYVQRLAGILARRAGTPVGDGAAAFLTGAPWFADCSLMAKGGIPSIAFGPGSIGQAHTRDEFIEIAELEKGAEVFFDLLTALE
ncbi:MAG: M20 family metallopeptidase [Verrucomicrobia bacterium]|nr:M20 family metallopeptidase [Verrucomicrobiota bacterium]